jgi:hypothetical protein
VGCNAVAPAQFQTKVIETAIIRQSRQVADGIAALDRPKFNPGCR